MKIEEEIKFMRADTKNVLARAGKAKRILERPYSIVTTLPRRMRGRWD